MTHYDYRVIPAPRRMRKVKGVGGASELFAHTLGEAINEQAAQGWEFLRSEAMVVEGPRGWFRAGKVAEHTVLVFRRERFDEAVSEPADSWDNGDEVVAERPKGLLRREPRESRGSELRAGEPDERVPTPLRPTPRLGPANKS